MSNVSLYRIAFALCVINWLIAVFELVLHRPSGLFFFGGAAFFLVAAAFFASRSPSE